jgi:biopolymer transport protein ExbB
MRELLSTAGLVLVPIAVCSVVGLAIALERAWACRTSRVLDAATTGRVRGLVQAGQLDEAAALCRGRAARVAVARLLVAVFEASTKAPAARAEAFDVAGRTEAARLEKRLEGLATIATITPLLGLLGTVLGMIEAFQLVEVHGFSDPSRFASGIWKALITTAAGLSVAIPSFVAYRVLLSRIDSLLLQLEQEARSVAAVVWDQKP